MRKVISKMFSRVTFTALFMILQILVIVAGLVYFRNNFAIIYVICVIISVAVVVHIVNENSNPAYKIAWIIPILVLPVFGGLLYLMFGKNRLSVAQKDRLLAIQQDYIEAMEPARSAMDQLEWESKDAALQAAYISNCAFSPVFVNTDTEYLPTGEDVFQHMLEELSRAEKYIFLEYFIIEPGVMWDTILDILKDKASQGVDVRVMYDDFGSIFTVPSDFAQQLQAQGIKCCVFHRFVPVLSGRFNNRDHRKICVVDGDVAFTGGINLADEYINKRERFGHWQDCGVMVKGDAAWAFSAMFLSMWSYVNNTSCDMAPYLPPVGHSKPYGRGYVVPFNDNPLDNEPVGETVYINILARAKKYVYICTPYLIIGNEMLTALVTAAKCGIDVRIITPHIPDKKTAFAMTRSYYQVLLEAGVKIYEYTPGFIHSKTFVCDDEYGVVGSINMDFRSLYLHYECAAWMYKTDAVIPMRESFEEILKRSQEIDLEWCRKRPLPARLVASLLRSIAPLF